MTRWQELAQLYLLLDRLDALTRRVTEAGGMTAEDRAELVRVNEGLQRFGPKDPEAVAG